MWSPRSFSYRPAAGEERSTPAAKVSLEALLRASPWRTFRSYSGQLHYPGTYWSSTQRGHVIYESRLELANLLLADYDQGVREISAQPFPLTGEEFRQAQLGNFDERHHRRRRRFSKQAAESQEQWRS